MEMGSSALRYDFCKMIDRTVHIGIGKEVTVTERYIQYSFAPTNGIRKNNVSCYGNNEKR